MSSSMQIWWDASDGETAELINQLGGKHIVEAAIDHVLPNRRVKLQALRPGISGAVVFLACPEKRRNGRLITEVDGVLKIGPAGLLVDEVNRYEQWVSHILEHSSHFAPLNAPEGLTALAETDPTTIQAIHYRHVGHVTFGERFRELLKSGDMSAASQMIDSLFTILRPWQEMVDAIGSDALTSPGVYSFGANPFDEFEAMCEHLNETYAQGADAVDRRLYTDVRKLWTGNALRAERQLRSVVHGDLHVDNILVGNDNALTLIDFGATGEGHFLRDLSTLEVHLILRTMSPKGSMLTSHQRQYVTELAPLYTPRTFLDPRLEGSVTPLQALVLRLRRYALYCLMHFRQDYVPQYVIALLRHSIRICTRPDFNDDSQRWIAMKVSTMLRQALKIDRGRLMLQDRESNSRPEAFSFLDDPVRKIALPDQLNIPATERCTADTWLAVAKELRGARRVDFVGVTPLPLISALMGDWARSGVADQLPKVHYLTRGTAVPSSPVWKVALTGMRAVANLVSGSLVSIDGFARAGEGPTNNCLIRRIGRDDHVSLLFASQIAEDLIDAPSHLLSEVPDPDGRISEWVTTTVERADPIVIHEVDCQVYENAPTAALPTFAAPEVLRLAPYGAATERSHCLRPVALTILRARGPSGLQVMLKRRTALTDNDDFGKLSFLSARVLAEDVAAAFDHILEPVQDTDDDLQALWEGIGCPEPFVLQEPVFIHAARRDVYSTTLLNLPAERFKFKGMHIIDREGSTIQLGFAVLLVDLDASELSTARQAGRAMLGYETDLLRVALVSELFDGSLPVNRFMQNRKDWLMAHCLRSNTDPE